MPATIIRSNQITTKSVKVLQLDANIIIPYIDINHRNHPIFTAEINRLLALKIKLYYSQPVLLEVINYWRLKVLFHALQVFIQTTGSANLPQPLVALFNAAHRRFLNPNPKHRGYLFDSDVKKIRDEIMNFGGIGLWNSLISVMIGNITSLSSNLSSIPFNYSKFGKKPYPAKLKRNYPTWSNQLKLVENFALSSNDAAILNMADFPTIDGLISNDADMMFAAQNGGFNKHLVTIP